MFSSNKTNDVVFISIISRKIQGFQSQFSRSTTADHIQMHAKRYL
ncbi:hypothetical protein CPTD_01394 [Corynebacterium pseudotuberculosis]|nr:hypothetical protein CPTD_01394 [Corynebacterium pseudotuberculosis]